MITYLANGFVYFFIGVGRTRQAIYLDLLLQPAIGLLYIIQRLQSGFKELFASGKGNNFCTGRRKVLAALIHEYKTQQVFAL